MEAVFEFIRTIAVDGEELLPRDTAQEDVLQQNQFGATLGGPIFAIRRFFFASMKDSVDCGGFLRSQMC